MAHPADFANAHVRHWRDAEYLFDAGRWGNADQLYGLSAECGLKAVMVADGLPVDAAGSPRRGYKEHVDTLWGIFHTFAQGRRTGHLLHHLRQQSNPFASWSVHNRYANDVRFNQTAVAPHRTAARKVRIFYLRLKERGHV